MGKRFIKHSLTFMITVISCMLLLTIVNCIPQTAIKSQVECSTAYLKSNPGFPVVIENLENTRMDNYADSMLINVVYNVDSESPFKAMVVDEYYRIDGNNATDDLDSSVNGGLVPQNNYSRYWHGMQMFVRPLLTVFSLSSIRYMLGAVLLALSIWLCVLLYKRGYRVIMGIYIASLLAVDFWMCTFTIEYLSVFLLATILSILIVYMRGKSSDGEGVDLKPLFIIGGVLTCFFDFLTAETLTFTIPMILYLLMEYKDGKSKSAKETLKQVTGFGLCWIISYALMFAIKWALVYFICGKTALITALTSAAERIDGTVFSSGAIREISVFEYIRVIILRNLGCLFHIPGSVSASSVVLVAIIIAIALLSFFYLFRKNKFDKSAAIPLLLIGLLPYIRFVSLRNHSCLHYFFTYRTQMATVLAILGILYISTDMLQFRKRRRK